MLHGNILLLMSGNAKVCYTELLETSIDTAGARYLAPLCTVSLLILPLLLQLPPE